MGLNSEYAKRLRELLATADSLPDHRLLSKALVLSSVWRSKLWANTLVASGTEVRTGPFKGMQYVVASAEGALLPRLLGVYERELHPDLYAFAREDVEAVIDIGCAEGYYAVGLARLLPSAKVYAYDTDETARRRCGILARENGVADRVEIREMLQGTDFETFRGRRTLVFIDAEGFEDEILDPALYPSLADFSLIVETHPMHRPGVTDRLIQRFSATHAIRRLDPEINAAKIDPQIAGSSHLDMMLAVWEWRAGPTPWLVMRPKDWAHSSTG